MRDDAAALREQVEALRAEVAELRKRPRGSAIVLPRGRARVVLALLLTIVPVAAYTATIAVPNTFVNGTVADADEVNANFTTLVTESNDQHARIAALEGHSHAEVDPVFAASPVSGITAPRIASWDLANSWGDHAAAGYAASAHAHDGSAITTGTVALARLPTDGVGDCSAGSVCAGGHSHSDKLSTSGGTISGTLIVTGDIAWGGNFFASGALGYLLVGAVGGASCTTVCSNHSMNCSGIFGPYALPGATATTCASTSGVRICGCF